jgi:hypothetical protein
MSNQLKVANFDSGTLKYKIVSDTTLGAGANVDVTTGSGTLYNIDVDNQDASNPCYVKISLTASTVTVGTTVPDIILKLATSTAYRITIPGGVAFSKLSFWQTTTAADAATTTSATPVIVTMVTS